MGQIIKNSNGTFSMNGFSNKNPADMEAIKEACFSGAFPGTEKKLEEKPAQIPKGKK